MEFKVFQKELELQSRGWIPTFHDVSKEVTAAGSPPSMMSRRKSSKS